MSKRGAEIRWCTWCRDRGVPSRALPGSELCASCDQSRKAAYARAAAEQARGAEEEWRAQASLINTGMGVCQSCGGRNIVERAENEGKGAQDAACCVGCLFFWPALLVAPFLGRKARFRTCQLCGHEWRV